MSILARGFFPRRLQNGFLNGCAHPNPPWSLVGSDPCWDYSAGALTLHRARAAVVVGGGHRSTSYVPTMVPNKRAPAMNADDLKAVIPELECFHQRSSRSFCRTEGRAARWHYLTGLLLPIERQNVENVAEQVGVPIRPACTALLAVEHQGRRLYRLPPTL
jgi:hypothetical protein